MMKKFTCFLLCATILCAIFCVSVAEKFHKMKSDIERDETPMECVENGGFCPDPEKMGDWCCGRCIRNECRNG
uniref:U1-sicaritoxin-Sdo1a n=1 Tax=Hexophthalma dolichocephala TaxID=2599099 RepID=KNO64_HEXDO|nr:RecName: Full=U1-sicaritoxin-Sdo1a; Short=U1-SCRTX-Sdo1a; AltName: Full=S64; AltName: Full=U1-sicaritoxin-Sd1a; Short=U1-SCRTX-Sd1a; Flags: Precursor [Sicarius dolichocephalus]